MAIYNTNISGGLNTKDCTADASKILDGYTAGVGKEIVTGTMADNGDVSTAIVDGVLKEGYTSGGVIESMMEMPKGVVRSMTVASGCEVKKGDYVAFNDGTWGTPKQFSSVKYESWTPRAIEIGENKIFSTSSPSSATNIPYWIYDVEGNTLVEKASGTIGSTCAKYYPQSDMISITENKFLMVYANVNNGLNAMIVEVNNDVPTVLDDIVFSTSYPEVGMGNAKYYNTCKIGENKYLVVYLNSSSYVVGRVCKVDNDSISLGAEKQISTSTSAYNVAVTLEDNKILVVYGGASLNAVVCTINDTTIAVGTVATVGSSRYGYYLSAFALNPNNVLICHTSGSSYTLMNIYCTINGTAVTFGASDTAVGVSDSFSYAVAQLRDNSFLVFDTDSTLKYKKTGFDMSSSSFSSLGSVSSTFAYPMQLSNGVIVVLHSGGGSSYYRYGTVQSQPTIKRAFGNQKYCVALESGTGGQTIKVLSFETNVFNYLRR